MTAPDDALPSLGHLFRLVLGAPLAVLYGLTDGGERSPLVRLALTTAISLWVLLIATEASPRALPRRLRAIGLAPTRGAIRQLVLGAVVGLVMGGGLVLAGVVATGGTIVLSATPAAVAGFVGSAAFFALAGLTEEALFRGVGVLQRERRVAAWVVASSVAFGALHGPNPGFGWLPFLTTATSGAAFAVVAIITGRLWASWGLHAGWNLGLAVSSVPVSGLTFTGIATAQLDARSAVFAPSHFGIEGTVGALALWAFVAGVALLVAMSRRSPATSRTAPSPVLAGVS